MPIQFVFTNLLYTMGTVLECNNVGHSIILGIRDFGKTVWFHDNEYIQKVIDVDDTDCVKVGGDYQHCSNRSFPVTYSVQDYPDGMLR